MTAELSLVADGRELRRWTRYEVDSDLLVPADAWNLAVDGFTAADRELLQPGATVQLLIAGRVQLTGQVDQVEVGRERGSRQLNVSGRDLAAPLVDCSAPPSSFFGKSLLTAAEELAAPWGIDVTSDDTSERRLAAGATVAARSTAASAVLSGGRARREDWAVQAGETVWSFLERGAVRAGLAMWMSPAGKLVLSRPWYDQAALYQLRHRETGATNVLTAHRRQSWAERFSTIDGVAVSGTSDTRRRHQVEDTELVEREILRPLRVRVEAATLAELQTELQRGLAMRIWASDELEYTVQEHEQDGLIWQPDTRVEVDDEVLGVEGLWYIIGRRFTHSRSDGRRTQLRLRRPGFWLA